MSVSGVTWVDPSHLHTSSVEAHTSCQHCPHLLLEGWAGEQCASGCQAMSALV